MAVCKGVQCRLYLPFLSSTGPLAYIPFYSWTYTVTPTRKYRVPARRIVILNVLQDSLHQHHTLSDDRFKRWLSSCSKETVDLNVNYRQICCICEISRGNLAELRCKWYCGSVVEAGIVAPVYNDFGVRKLQEREGGEYFSSIFLSLWLKIWMMHTNRH